MLRLINRREKAIIVMTAAMILFAAIFNFLLSPLLTKNEALNREIALTKSKLNKYALLLSQKDFIYEQYDKVSGPAGLREGAADAKTGLLSQLQDLARASGIRIIDMRPQASTSADSPQSTNVDLKTEGSAQDYLKFIYDLENSTSLMHIKRLQLNAKSRSELLEGSFSLQQRTTSTDSQ